MDDLEKHLRKIAAELRSKENMEEIGEIIKADLIKRTRLGYGVDGPQGTRERLAPLTPKYQMQRRLWRKRGVLSRKTQPAKSNLTKTAHMLDSIKVEAKPGIVRLVFGDSFAEKKAEWVSGKRPFFNLTKTEYSRAIKWLREKVKGLLDR